MLDPSNIPHTYIHYIITKNTYISEYKNMHMETLVSEIPLFLQVG